ncbi:MAG: nicotinamide riboside transporter PnuC [Bacteroidota bacterium]|jgi:nicotinamide mononucleotide transporter
MPAIAIEILSVVSNILYLLLLTKKDIRCWAFGIVGSALGVWLMVHATLYGQALIYTYYVLMGIYGWWHWHSAHETNSITTEWKLRTHTFILGALTILSIGMGLLLKQYSNSQYPFADAALTLFGFGATFMQVRKIRSSWIYWFVIDTAGAILYFKTGLQAYALLMAVYASLCVSGYLQWKKSEMPT